MKSILCVGIGGLIGSILRYLVSTYSAKFIGNQFPYGTLIVNVAGGILIGLILEVCAGTNAISPNLKLFLTTGIMGGLTTFSTFSYETIQFFTAGNYGTGLLNTALNLFLSFGGVLLGKYIGSGIIS